MFGGTLGPAGQQDAEEIDTRQGVQRIPFAQDRRQAGKLGHVETQAGLVQPIHHALHPARHIRYFYCVFFPELIVFDIVATRQVAPFHRAGVV